MDKARYWKQALAVFEAIYWIIAVMKLVVSDQGTFIVLLYKSYNVLVDEISFLFFIITQAVIKMFYLQVSISLHLFRYILTINVYLDTH